MSSLTEIRVNIITVLNPIRGFELSFQTYVIGHRVMSASSATDTARVISRFGIALMLDGFQKNWIMIKVQRGFLYIRKKEKQSLARYALT